MTAPSIGGGHVPIDPGTGMVWGSDGAGHATPVAQGGGGGALPDGVTLDALGAGGTLEIINTGVIAGSYGDANHIPIITVNAKGQVTTVTTVGAESLQRTINQTAHGFTVGTPTIVRYNGAAWVKSKADAAANADVDGLAVATDANNFTLYLSGSDVSGFTGLTAGNDYYLDPSTAGAFTTTAPSTAGQVIVPVIKAISTTESIFLPKLGLVVPPAAVTYVAFKLVDDSTSVSVAESKIGYTIPALLNGKSLSYVDAACTVAPTGTGLSFGVRKNAATEMLTTNVTIDTTKLTSDQSAVQPVIKSDGSQTVATGDVVWVDCDQADSNSASRGSIVTLGFS